MTTAYKLTLLLTRREDLSQDEFADAWLELDRRHPLVVPGLVGYVFNRPLPVASPVAGAISSRHDAVVETWWTRKNDAADWVVSRSFEDGWLPPRLSLLADRPAAVAGIPNVIWERELADGETPVTVIVLPVARRSLRFEDFVEHWTGSHAQLALNGPETKDRVVRLEDTPAPLTPPTQFVRTRYDGVGAITFTSAAALTAEFASEYYLENLAPDEARFTNTVDSAVFVGTRIDLT